jgi:hypothetical protein
MATGANWPSIRDHITWMRQDIAAMLHEVEMLDFSSVIAAAAGECSTLTARVEASRQHIAELEAIIQRYSTLSGDRRYLK